VTLKLKSLKCLLKVMTFFCGKGFMRPNSVRLITLEGSGMGSECCFSNSTCKKIPGIQSNLSIPDPDKTEHLPKPNNFHGPDFFPYYSLLNKRAQRALGRPPEENVKDHSGAIYRGPLMLYTKYQGSRRFLQEDYQDFPVLLYINPRGIT